MAVNQSFQNPNVKNNPMVAIAGSEIGKTIRVKILNSDAPSILADSTMASGIVVLKKVRKIMIWNELTQHGKIKAHIVFFNPKKRVLIKYDATSPPENNIGIKINFVKNWRYVKFLRDRA